MVSGLLLAAILELFVFLSGTSVRSLLCPLTGSTRSCDLIYLQVLRSQPGPEVDDHPVKGTVVFIHPLFLFTGTFLL